MPSVLNTLLNAVQKKGKKQRSDGRCKKETTAKIKEFRKIRSWQRVGDLPAWVSPHVVYFFQAKIIILKHLFKKVNPFFCK